MAFIVLVAVGADYNMLLISRIRDESPDAMRSGVILTIRSTGVIASAGMLFAVHMLAMLFSRIGSIVQGEVVAVGLATENQAGDAAGRRRRRFDREWVKAGGSVGESGSARQIAVS
jgi:MMPL family